MPAPSFRDNKCQEAGRGGDVGAWGRTEITQGSLMRAMAIMLLALRR